MNTRITEPIKKKIHKGEATCVRKGEGIHCSPPPLCGAESNFPSMAWAFRKSPKVWAKGPIPMVLHGDWPAAGLIFGSGPLLSHILDFLATSRPHSSGQVMLCFNIA